ncbi:MAG TPA: hypothetical protein VFQ65_23955 [Kofleriaceae bacterium]|nr:hypothetical protein [Kofleriaceae bacterium]
MFESITPAQLADVTGGANRVASGASNTDINKTMALAVQQLQSSIQSVAQQFQSGQSDSQNMQQMMGMMMQMKGR